MKLHSIAFAIAAITVPTIAAAERVNVGNFVRAETDRVFRQSMEEQGVGIGEIVHLREPASVESRIIARATRDMLLSTVVLDLSEPVSVTLPYAGGRYQSMQVINQDHFSFVEAGPGDFVLTRDTVGTRFAMVVFRTFVDWRNPDDIQAAHAAQDALEISGGGPGPFEAPDWDADDLALIRDALNHIASLGFDPFYAFGLEVETRPVDHLVGAAAGWGGLRATAVYYAVGSVAANDGTTPHEVTVGNVPVDGFWSVTVYDADGFLVSPEPGDSSYSNITADPNDDGSITVSFGGCEDGRSNCLTISPGWTYTVRFYEPQPDIVLGRWTFPEIQPTR